MLKKILIIVSLFSVLQGSIHADQLALLNDIEAYVKGKTEQQQIILARSAHKRIVQLLGENAIGRSAFYSTAIEELRKIGKLEDLLYLERLIRDYLLSFADTYKDNITRICSHAFKGAVAGSLIGLVIAHFFWVKDLKQSKVKAAAKYLYAALSAGCITAVGTSLMSHYVLKQKKQLFFSQALKLYFYRD